MITPSFYSRYQKFLSLLIIITLGFAVYAYFKLSELPDASFMLSKLASEPSQTATNREKFDFNYEGSAYTVEPVADYEISGLIVTHNNISSITDAYHTSKSVDLKDLCVIWGDNVKDNNFKQFKYWSEPWTCNFHTESRDALNKFNQRQLSNNHLVGATENVRELIKKSKVGDQVTFSGMLVNYYPKGEPDLRRRTSTVRSDTGNGACEVVFVENFKIDREWKPVLAKAYANSKLFLIILIVLKILGFIILPQIEYRMIKIE